MDAEDQAGGGYTDSDIESRVPMGRNRRRIIHLRVNVRRLELPYQELAKLSFRAIKPLTKGDLIN
jgi:hypothetical protein